MQSTLQSHKTVVFLESRALIHNTRGLYLVDPEECSPLVSDLTEVHFLTASPNGRHFAFYSGEGFQLWSVDGAKVFERPVNTDKSVPTGIHFSSNGDAVAFAWHYDGGHRMHLFEIEKGHSIEYYYSAGSVGFSPDLRRFVMTGEDFRVGACPIEMKVLDRRKDVRGTLSLPFHEWTALVIDSQTQEHGVLRRGNLYWFTPAPGSATFSMLGIIPDQSDSPCSSSLLLSSTQVVTFSPRLSLARLYSRRTGRVIIQNNISGVSMSEAGSLSWNKGKIDFFGENGSLPIPWTPRSGHLVLAANQGNGQLFVCEQSAKGIRVNSYPLQL